MVTAASTLIGCAQVQPATGDLVEQLRLLPIVDSVTGYATPGNPFEDPESSIDVSVKSDADPKAIADMVGLWRDEVDALTGDVSLSVDQDHDDGTYATLSIDTRPDRDELVALAEVWGTLAPQASSLDIYLDDYDPDTFASVNVDVDPAADLHEVLAGLADSSADLNDTISWSVSRSYPSQFSFYSNDGLPDADTMDVVAGLGTALETEPTPVRIDVSSYTYDSTPRHLTATIEFDPPGLSDVTDSDAEIRVRVDPVWLSMQTYVDRLPHDAVETSVDFQIFDYRVGGLDTENCNYREANITGPLTDDLWQYWLRDGSASADGSTAFACASS